VAIVSKKTWQCLGSFTRFSEGNASAPLQGDLEPDLLSGGKIGKGELHYVLGMKKNL